MTALPTYSAASVAFLLGACVPHAASGGTDEGQQRAACARGKDCAVLATRLETESPSASRSREAITLMQHDAPGDFTSAQLAVLLTDAHPDLASVAERGAAWRTLCEVHRFTSACELGARRMAAEQPALAEALRSAACAQGDAWLCARASPTAPVLPTAFTDELAAVGATFEMPAGFHVIPTVENPHLSTELSILSDDGRMEVRYALRDDSEMLAMLDQCKNQPNCIGADAFKAEVAFGLTGAMNLFQVSPEQLPLNPLPAVPVRIEFNANWGIVTAARVDTAFSRSQPPTTFMYLHRDPGANLYVVMLMHDPTAMSDVQPVVFHALRFKEPVGLGGKWL